ncbi:GNAT family N-acetyltransferase [Aliifodinibius sp. S!AR15-10]|uniref:GNAT family N-acetyltransferase n=1 Tax=Aliifodinibius sp. S!AR15-10 TaxID=2950437 RepID=UPI002862E28B|nr:GNAT family N-acetyltransferase [Aliifodinibius sp. S!AR15-10]MDR8392633.1 GNAT family N-acetyltransferase [Aliifodinibius sp. S!AR15-10]
MRFVIGNAGEKYDYRLSLLIKLFVMKRIMKGGPILGVIHDGVLLACVTVTSPHDRSTDDRLEEIEEYIWNELGQDAQNRYKALCKLWSKFEVGVPHYHINMIGVRSLLKSRGLGSKLLEAVHKMSYDDPDSTGVTLTTEDPSNVPFYQHHGYKVKEYFISSKTLGTWCFFRPDK